ncbi:MAG: hypothetical protein COZ53_01050 [Candidatus Altarchaeum sp. CG_4_8_14_3_um_filter_33_2054]|nr:MAG: hypothetical protein AUK59_06615 [Candidatus Altarchaeum sp. CG2_30_32_3053]PIX49323.1 MAG: hypothetical protein COZ53_01050 [Candidatus Altarchaeum sp. CG_4_8_14_3_um_filter_33_2054]PJC13897.1 MAG: hypothetical protein CO063_03430 [Candidatus Altarchaeum sp. CG_4_9_14_0_8_um_filter_32_206]
MLKMSQKNLNLKGLFVIGGIGIVLMMVMISGCTENDKNKEVNDTTDYKSIVKNNIKAEYDWKIIELKTTTLKAASENDELIENETEKILKNITKEGLLKDAEEYGLDEEKISYIKNLNAEEFENFKNEELKQYAVDAAREYIKDALKKVVDEYNWTILEIKSKDEIKDIDVYLDAYSIGEDMKEDVKKKINNGTYIAVVEMDVATKFNVVEICDEKGKIIK